MHKLKLILGASFVIIGAVFLSLILYDYLVTDCADIYDIQEMQEKSCIRTPNSYIFLVLSLMMLVFGAWLVVFGVRAMSLITGKN